MSTHSEVRGSRRFRTLLAALAVAVTCAFAAAPAIADPGQANQNDAASAVYPTAVGDNSGVLAEEVSGDVGAEEVAGTATEPPESSSLPFTGFVAPVLLAIGLSAIVIGLVLRRFRERPGHPA